MDRGHGISEGEATRVWVRVALNSFGGPAGQIAVMHRILVDELRWISEARFLHALNYCMLLPGPEAQQLATYVGWLLHGPRGGLIAGTLFVLPGFVSILVLSYLYVAYSQIVWVAAALFGVKAAVLAVVVEAVVRIGKRVLVNRVMFGVAALAFVAIFFFAVPFPAVVVAAGVLGLVGHSHPAFQVIKPRTAQDKGPVARLDAWLDAHPAPLPTPRRSLGVLSLGLGLWLGPLVLLGLILGWEHTLVKIGAFFSQAAVVTFGGAYSVLAYVAQEAVGRHGWLTAVEMLDGLGMAETTPGPLIQVVQYVGFIGAWRDPGAWPPWLSGLAGAVVSTYVTFAPCYLWVFLGAPYMEWLRGRAALTAALSTITAAVVGVVLNLAFWFSLHVVFTRGAERSGPLGTRLYLPELASLDLWALLIAAGAMVAMLRFHVGMLTTLAVSAALGLLRTWM